jgi:hypothetical protein
MYVCPFIVLYWSKTNVRYHRIPLNIEINVSDALLGIWARLVSVMINDNDIFYGPGRRIYLASYGGHGKKLLHTAGLTRVWQDRLGSATATDSST